jgi:thiosulfate dehydrogenase [quinone] large subunit
MASGVGTPVGLFLLRVLVGAQFVLAAWSKVWPNFSFSSFENGWLKQPELKGYLQGYAEAMRPELGFYKDLLVNTFIPHANVLTYGVVFGEFLVGVALILGLLTRIASAFGALMAAAIFLASWEVGPMAQMAFQNQAFITMILCLVILLSGAGLRGGIDGRIRRPKS